MYSVENMRNSQLKDVRSRWKNDRFFYGKNRVMQLALGRTEAEEYKEGLHHVAEVWDEGVEGGGWRVEGWRVEDGGWRDGGWRDGGWRMEDGGWRVEGRGMEGGGLW